ncbi:MAG: TIM barrel protein, partial [Clostridia bacterium]
MKLSTTVNFFIYPDDGSFDTYRADLRHYAALGFDCLDAIFCSAADEGSPLLTDRWQEWARAMRTEADQLGIRFVQTHLPFYNFCDPARGIDPRVEAVSRKAIVCTQILGAKWTVAHPATAFAEPMVMAASKTRNIAYFSELLAFAKQYDVGICIENMADFAGQGYPRSYCAPVEELCDLVDTLSLQYDNVGICWDFGHANLFYRDQRPCLAYLGKRLKVTHV